MGYINLYCTDLTLKAKQGELDSVVGRHREMEEIQQILCKRKKNNPILVGDPGVGKTLIIEGLAQCIAKGTVPLKLHEKQVFSLDTARVIACSSNPGDLKEIVSWIVDEIEASNGEFILFVDDIHELLGAVSSDGANAIMKLALAKGEMKCIGATTPDEYSKYIEKDSSLRRHFQAVNVPELTVDETVEILKGLGNEYGQFHGVAYEHGALVVAALLSKEHSSSCFLPGMAVDLIDEAGSRARLLRRQESDKQVLVTEDDVRQVVSMRTGSPVSDNLNKGTVKIYSKATPNYNITIRDGQVILSPSDPGDEYQHWYKNVSSWAKDKFGRPAFSLVNTASGEAMDHPMGETHPVGLVPFNSDSNHGESVLWTQGKERTGGYRSMRVVNNVHLNLDAFGGIPECGGVHDGTSIGLWKWNGGDNQLWMIMPW